MPRVSRLDKVFCKRLEHLQFLLKLADIQPKTWVEANTIYQKVHPYLMENREEIMAIFPRKMSQTLRKMNGTQKNDRRLVTSWLRKIFNMYNIQLVYDWQHRRNNGIVESVFRYSVIS